MNDDGTDACLPLADWAGDADRDTRATADAVTAGADQIITAIRTVARELRAGQMAQAERAVMREAAPTTVTVVAPSAPRLPWRAIPVRDPDNGLILYIDIVPIEEGDR